MHYDIQKAGLWRRFAAGLLDLILLVILVCGAAWGMSAILDTDGKYQAVNDIYMEYGSKFGVDFNLSSEDAATMSTEDMNEYNENVDAAIDAMNKDEAAVNTLMEYWYSILSMLSTSVLIGHLILEFAMPVILKNGQTVGKKVFGIALMRKDGVKASVFSLFVRSILGKCTIEVMLPILILFLMFLGVGGILVFLLMALAIAQVALYYWHRNSCLIHDLLACTVAVDLSSQLIFDSPEALLEYQKARGLDKAENAEY